MDENLLFTAEVLTLNDDLVFSRVSSGEHVIKNMASQGYLTVNDGQLRALYYFQTGKTVPAVLEEMIRDRTSLVFRDYFELVLKAYRVGVLQSERRKSAHSNAIRWFALPGGKHTLFFSLMALLIALGFIGWAGITPSTHWYEWVVSWLVACIGLSLGEALAAGILRASGGEVYHPQFKWLRLFPRFSLDLRDDAIISHQTGMSVELMRCAPLALWCVFLLAWHPSYAFLSVCALLINIRPLHGGLIGRLSLLMRRRPILSIDEDLLFAPNRSPSHRFMHELRMLEWRMVLFELGGALLWTIFVFRSAIEAAQLPLDQFRAPPLYWLGAAGAIALSIVLFVGAWLGYAIQPRILAWISDKYELLRVVFARFFSRKQLPERPDLRGKIIRENPLLRRLDYPTQQELAKLIRPFECGAWQMIIDKDQEPGHVGLIVSGTITSFRRNKAGRRTKHTVLSEGDLFGCHALVDPFNPRMEMRTNTPLKAFIVPAEEFRVLVINKLGRNAVYEATQKQVFLRRLSLCSGWKAHIVQRFAQISQVVHYRPGELIIQMGQESRAFYVLFEGEAKVMRAGKKIGRIRPGGYIGEIGILQNSETTADVEAVDDCLCFIVNRSEFLRFISHNYTVALQIEGIASARLGRSLYPLDPFSFDA